MTLGQACQRKLTLSGRHGCVLQQENPVVRAPFTRNGSLKNTTHICPGVERTILAAASLCNAGLRPPFWGGLGTASTHASRVSQRSAPRAVDAPPKKRDKYMLLFICLKKKSCKDPGSLFSCARFKSQIEYDTEARSFEVDSGLRSLRFSGLLN